MALQRSFRLNQVLRVVLSECKNSSIKIRTVQTETQPAVKPKEKFLQRWGKYWKSLYLDYRDVAIDVAKEFRQRPLRCSGYVATLGSLYFFSQHNPDMCSYRDQLLNNESKITQVAQPLRNPDSEKYVTWVEQCCNEGIIRHLNLGIISFIWLDNYDESSAVYKATCSYLKPQYLKFYQRIIDIGFLDKWWLLEDKMHDYDVNIAQF
ncbi:mitochondrial import inner membrane translocase subunit Tim29 [Leptopilina heterotoma]|uniref:mitochondrial import inner membrane translocase subunit Tim29 n=1 Tax=Leptopilina heterotoma TaxID=63436 RepID=UPI001CAA3220|nr:mitochondrial import inner membrane translocase subunit Tim29 [Leptopilina heterotoma]